MGSWVDFGSIGLPQRKILDKIHWTAANKVSGIHQQPTPFQPAGCCLKLWYPKIGFFEGKLSSKSVGPKESGSLPTWSVYVEFFSKKRAT